MIVEFLTSVEILDEPPAVAAKRVISRSNTRRNDPGKLQILASKERGEASATQSWWLFDAQEIENRWIDIH